MIDETLRVVSFSLVVFREAKRDVNINGQFKIFLVYMNPIKDTFFHFPLIYQIKHLHMNSIFDLHGLKYQVISFPRGGKSWLGCGAFTWILKYMKIQWNSSLKDGK